MLKIEKITLHTSGPFLEILKKKPQAQKLKQNLKKILKNCQLRLGFGVKTDGDRWVGTPDLECQRKMLYPLRQPHLSTHLRLGGSLLLRCPANVLREWPVKASTSRIKQLPFVPKRMVLPFGLNFRPVKGCGIVYIIPPLPYFS